jgi:tetratricopeptide (TPR) repeat protein
MATSKRKATMGRDVCGAKPGSWKLEMNRTLEDAEIMIRQLIEDGLEDTADKLCSLFLSSNSFPSSSPSHDLLYELQGDCASLKEEYTRSIQLYRQSMKQNGSSKKFHSVNSTKVATIHYKISQCYLKLKDQSAAIRELEIIPKELRTTKMNICLGKLYYSADLKLSANSVLKQILKINPLALECQEMLINLGVDPSEFIPKAKSDLYPPSHTHDLNSTCLQWVNSISTTLSCHRQSQFKG